MFSCVLHNSYYVFIVPCRYAQRKRTLMNNCEIFAKNFKQLRLTHSLSMSELALILNFKNKSTIAQLETIKMLPSFETLINIANVFAVKVDWLVGRSSQPYDEEIILNLENQIIDIKVNSGTVFQKILPPLYSDVEKRAKFFSLAERANLIFLLQYMKIITENEPELLHGSQNSSKENIIEFLLEKVNLKKPRLKNAQEIYFYLLRAIGAILLNDMRNPIPFDSDEPCFRPKPLFDITKEVEN